MMRANAGLSMLISHKYIVLLGALQALVVAIASVSVQPATAHMLARVKELAVPHQTLV